VEGGGRGGDEEGTRRGRGDGLAGVGLGYALHKTQKKPHPIRDRAFCFIISISLLTTSHNYLHIVTLTLYFSLKFISYQSLISLSSYFMLFMKSGRGTVGSRPAHKSLHRACLLFLLSEH